MAKGEGQGEAGGVEGAVSIGTDPGADEVVAVRVGEEPVAAAAGGVAPSIDGEGEPTRHLYRHPPQNVLKLQLDPPLGRAPCFVYRQQPPSSGRKTSRLTGFGVSTPETCCLPPLQLGLTWERFC
jgi:hypothetical protein